MTSSGNPPQREIEAQELVLNDIFSNKYFFEIPPYQRPYAWTTEQVSALLDDLRSAMDGYEKIEETPPYFLGSMVLIQGQGSTRAEVVDGQQRLTTLTILLCVLRELSEKQDQKDELDNFIKTRGGTITGIAPQFRLSLREKDREFFEKNVQKIGCIGKFLEEKSSQSTDSRQRIYENTQYFWNELQADDFNESQRVRLAQFLIQRCYLVLVSTSDIDGAYRIFAVMNDRGLDLLPTDILKSEIIGAIEDKGDQKEYTNKWETIENYLGREGLKNLFAHIRMIELKEKQQETLNKEFREKVLGGDRLKELPKVDFIDKILEPRAEVYWEIKKIKCNSPEESIKAKIENDLRFLGRLDNFDWEPPAILFFEKQKNKYKELAKFTHDLERLAYSLFIQRVWENGRIKRYAGVLKAIENNSEMYSGDSNLQLTLWEKRETLRCLNEPIPSRVIKPLLLRLTELISDDNMTYDREKVSVEHVLPRNPAPGSKWLSWFSDKEREFWTDRLANLVLLSRRKNAKAQNYDFDEKKNKYFGGKNVSTHAVTVQVINEEEWTPQVLERRQKALIDLLKKEWRLE